MSGVISTCSEHERFTGWLRCCDVMIYGPCPSATAARVLLATRALVLLVSRRWNVVHRHTRTPEHSPQPIRSRKLVRKHTVRVHARNPNLPDTVERYRIIAEWGSSTCSCKVQKTRTVAVYITMTNNRPEYASSMRIEMSVGGSDHAV